MVTLAQSFLIRFLPNFIYGLLPSTFLPSLNKGFVPHPVTKMAVKIAADYQCQLSWSPSNLVIFYWISFKFHIWIAFIEFSFKFEYGFCLTNDNNNLIIFNRISSKVSSLFPSNSCSSSNTSLVRRTITKMANKMAAFYQFAFVDNLP